MLKQASVEDIAQRRITKLHGQIVVVTHYYPRFLKRQLIHEYTKILAPSRELLSEFKTAEALCGHEEAFAQVGYEEKFQLISGAAEVLGEMANLAFSRDVYLVCHCKVGTRCHREILLLLANSLTDVPIARVHFPWTTILRRIKGELGPVLVQTP
jgi:uncharacterized protein YeaO (DUF488 family)